MDLTNKLNLVQQNQTLNVNQTDDALGLTSTNQTTFTAVPTQTPNTKNVNTSFSPTKTNDEITAEMQQEVEYTPSRDIAQEKSQIISYQEQERMQKIRQKELLINLQKSTTTTAYNRSADESVQMNAKNRANHKQELNDVNPRLQANDYLEDKIQIDSASEKFNQEINGNQKRKNYDDSESALKDFEENQKNKEQNHKKKKNIFYDLEDDEIVDIENIPTQIEISKETNNKFIIDRNSYAHKNKLKKFNRPHEEVAKNPALEKALRKETKTNNTNKLRQKFHKK